MSTSGPFAAEFAYAQVASSIAARIRAGRQVHRSQRIRLYVDLTTRATRFRSRPVEAITLSQPYLRTVGSIRVESPQGTYAEVPLRYGDTPEPTSEKPDDDNRSPGERVRQHDPGPLPTTAPNANQTSTAELLHGSAETPFSGNDGSRPVGSHPFVGSHVIREVVREEIQVYWSAPLPPPETLDQYDKIVPGMAGRILSMTERSVTGKIDIEDKLASAEIEAAKISISVAFGLTILAFAASVTFFALGNRVAGLAFLSFPVVMLIRSFLFRSDRNESVDNYNDAISAR
jgi:uncharacterized membrane protein